MKRKGKLCTIFLALAMVFTTAAACGPMGGGDGSSTPGTLSIWTVAPLTADYVTILKTNSKDKQALFTKYVVDTFSQQNNVKVKLYNKGWGDQLNEQVNRAIAGNKLPDIVCGEMYVPEYVRGKHFIELKLNGAEDHIIPAAKQYGTLDGKLYAAPAWTGSFSLAINKNVLKETGILDEDGNDVGKYSFSPLAPATWEQLLQVCEDIKAYYTERKETKKGGMLISNTKEGASWRALAFMRTADGGFVDADDKVNMDTPQNKMAFDMMRKLAKTAPDGAIASANEDALWDYFFNNKAAYIVEGIDSVTRTVNFANITEDDVVTCELPTFTTGGIKANLMVGTCYYGITKTSKNAELAAKFLEYMLSEEIQLKLMEYDMRIPIIDTVLGGEKIKEVSTYAKMDSYLKPLTDEDYSFSGGLPAFSNNPAQIWEKWYSFSSKLLKSNDNLDTILTTAHQEMLAAQERA